MNNTILHNVLLYGIFADKAGKTSIEVNLPPDTDTLRELLLKDFPAIFNTQFVIAVNKHVISENNSLQLHDEIALLPPFAGG